jgi:hypothetical protein
MKYIIPKTNALILEEIEQQYIAGLSSSSISQSTSSANSKKPLAHK